MICKKMKKQNRKNTFQGVALCQQKVEKLLIPFDPAAAIFHLDVRFGDLL